MRFNEGVDVGLMGRMWRGRGMDTRLGGEVTLFFWNWPGKKQSGVTFVTPLRISSWGIRWISKF